MLKFIKRDYLYLLSWLVLLLSIATTYANFDEYKYSVFLNSDTLGIANLYNDLVVNNGQIKDWYWAPSPSLFPDIAIYFILAAFKLNVVTTIFLAGLFQIILLTGMLVFIYNRLVEEEFKKYKWLIPFFLSIFFIESFYFSKDPLVPFLLFTIGFHIGAFLNTLILFCFYISSLSKPVKYVFLFVFSIIGSFNDRLYLIMLFVPFVLSWLCILKKTDVKHFLICTIVIFAGCVCGIQIFNWLGENKYVTFLVPHKIYAFENILPAWNVFYAQMKDYLSLFDFRSFQIAFTFCSVIFCIYYYFKNRKTAKTLHLFIVLFYAFHCLCTFFAPILNGNYTGYDTLRYNVYPFYFAAIIFAWGGGHLLQIKLKPIYATTASIGILLLFFILIGLKFNTKNFNNYFTYYPEQISEIDSVANKYNLKKGIADYWTARKTTIFSKKGVVVLSVYDGSNIHELGTNINWYYEGAFDFVIANSITPDAIPKNFTVRDTIKTKNYTLLLVDKYIYPRGEYFPKKIN